jgi:hypothetical protein
MTTSPKKDNPTDSFPTWCKCDICKKYAPNKGQDFTLLPPSTERLTRQQAVTVDITQAIQELNNKMDQVLAYLVEGDVSIVNTRSELQEKYIKQRDYLNSSYGEYLTAQELDLIEQAKDILDRKIELLKNKH